MKHFNNNVDNNKKGTNTSSNAKRRSILRVLSVSVKYVKCKIGSAHKRLVKKEPKKLLM